MTVNSASDRALIHVVSDDDRRYQDPDREREIGEFTERVDTLTRAADPQWIYRELNGLHADMQGILSNVRYSQSQIRTMKRALEQVLNHATTYASAMKECVDESAMSIDDLTDAITRRINRYFIDDSVVVTEDFTTRVLAGA